MNYPFWDISFSYGLFMAAIAIPHVFVAHFAIGGGLYLIVAESIARKKNDLYRLEFIKKLSKFFMLTTLVFGAVSGVGIWFIIGLLNPAATEALIHHYVWGWAIEWTFFAIEICSAIIYFYGWEKMSAKNHMIIGWIYFVSAWLSLFVINGIITFMLTPGEWLQTGYIWDGFFNPTFWSSLVLRTGVCIMLAGLFALLVSSRNKADEQKGKLVRFNSLWSIVGLAIMVPSLIWYVSDIPASIKEAAFSTNMTPFLTMNATYYNAGLLLIVLVVFGLLIPKRYNMIIAIIALAFGFSWFGEYEFMRESIRKPYVITEYMYANATEVADEYLYRENGYLPSIVFRTGDDGADLFRRACRSCHTIDGYKALKPAFDGTDETFITQSILGTHAMYPNMPEFLGGEEEARLIASHLISQIDRRHISEIYNLSGLELGEKVYDIRCGKCHIVGGFNDKTESLVDLDDEDYNDILDMAGDFADEMPDFTGDDVERTALIEYLKTLTEGDVE